MCPTCGTPLGLAFSPQAERERQFIRDQIEQGKTKDEIKDALVAEYGSNVLALPDDKGFDLTAYLVPAAAFFWRARPSRSGWCAGAAAAGPTSQSPTPSPSPPATPPGSSVTFRATTLSDTGTPSIFLAFAAGFVSFVSPCVLPLVPGYLSTVCGLSPSELQGARGAALRSVLLRAGLFILTFTLIFVLLGMTATSLGSTLADSRSTLEKVAGITIIAMGALFLLALVVPALNRDWHPDALMSRVGRGGPLVAGAAFAIAWTPCVGPALASILGLAATQDTVAEGGGLLAVYSAGLAVPFLLTAIAFTRATTAFGWIKRHYAVINALAGALLISIGILVLTGELFRLNVEAQRFLDQWDLNFFQEI